MSMMLIDAHPTEVGLMEVVFLTDNGVETLEGAYADVETLAVLMATTAKMAKGVRVDEKTVVGEATIGGDVVQMGVSPDGNGYMRIKRATKKDER